MLLVLIVHTDFVSIGAPTAHATVVANPLDAFIRTEIQSLSIICVNIFVIISGYFGIRPKLKGILNLLFQIIFWRFIIGLSFYITGEIGILKFCKFLIPGTGDWFVPCYLLLMMLAPIINSHLERSTSQQILRFLIIFYGTQAIFGWLLPYWPYGNGYSLISFIGLYILGQYIRHHLSPKIKKRITASKGIMGYVAISTTMAVAVTAFIYFVNHTGLDHKVMGFLEAYSSPVNILCVILLLIGFSNLHIQSRFINRMAQSAFIVYVIHCNNLVFPHYIEASRWIYGHFSIGGYAVGVVVLAVAVYLACAAADQIRIWLWNVISRRIPT